MLESYSKSIFQKGRCLTIDELSGSREHTSWVISELCFTVIWWGFSIDQTTRLDQNVTSLRLSCGWSLTLLIWRAVSWYIYIHVASLELLNHLSYLSRSDDLWGRLLLEKVPFVACLFEFWEDVPRTDKIRPDVDSCCQTSDWMEDFWK